MIDWAAEKLASKGTKRGKGDAAWYDDARLVERIVIAVNRGLFRDHERTTYVIRRNWVTRNHKTIEVRAKKLERAKELGQAKGT